MISIVIPTLNEEKYLPLILKSIKRQTFKEYEIIIADNDSKDSTLKIAEKYRCQITHGGHPGKARNSGAKIARYDLLFLDADIILRDTAFLKKLISHIEEDSLDIATCKILPDSRELIHIFYYFLKNFFNKYFGYFVPHASGQCIFIRKELFERIGGYDESLVLGEEHDLAKRAVSAGGKFRFYSDIIAYNSTRRIEKEGFVLSLLKTTYSEIFRLLFGKIKRKLFNYEFGNHV
jgi:glycosyltransferase involved in cell wall biosynthesis